MTTVTVDKQGRIVIPRQIRERLGLAIGQEARLHLWESGDGVMIEVEPRESRVQTGDDGLPVLEISGIEKIDESEVLAAIHRDRASR